MVGEYLQAYARAHHLERFVRLRCRVTDVRPCAPPAAGSRLGVDRWRVHWRDESAAAQEEEFDGVVVANGHYGEPVTPALPGMRDFQSAGGLLSHSCEYEKSEAFAGLDVLIVGARASGTDIAREMAAVARSVVVADPACAELEAVGAESGHRPAGQEGRAGPGLWRAPALRALGAGVHGPCATLEPRAGALAAAARARQAGGPAADASAPLELRCDAVIMCTACRPAPPAPLPRRGAVPRLPRLPALCRALPTRRRAGDARRARAGGG